jgi:hypothetical protein
MLFALAVTVACGRPSTVGVDPTPTYAPQPTPDRTMEAIILRGSPIALQPAAEGRSSPTAVPAAGRPADPQRGSTARSTPATAPTARPAATSTAGASNREPAPAAAPKPTATPARATSTPIRAPANAAPAIINPTTVLPGGPARQPIINPGR